jgi:energy-coupling factor transporter ATP-binding protein EcfA2
LKSRESIKQSKKINPSGITSINDAVKKILPSSIVIYYAGFDTKMKEMCQPHLQNQIEAFKKGNSSFQRAIIYCDDFDFKILTALYLSEAQNDEIKEIISNFDSEQQITQYLVLDDKKKPSKGLGQFIDLIVSESEGIATKIRIKPKLGLLGKDSKTIFENLDIAYNEGILKDIETGNYKDNQLSSENVFSEGQQQLLIIKALNKIFNGENCLFLFDEPDTFLHPKWQGNFIQHLEENNRNSQYIITSHSPFIAAALKKEQLYVMKKEDGEIIVKHPMSNPYGRTVDEILIDAFGLDSLRSTAPEVEINKIWDLIKSEQTDNEDFKRRLEQLEQSIGKDNRAITSIKIELLKRTKLKNAQN